MKKNVKMKVTPLLLPLLCLLISPASWAAGATVDTHFHLLSPGTPGNQSQEWTWFSDGYAQMNTGREPYAGAEQVLRALDQARIDKAVALSAAYFFSNANEAAAENTFAATEAARAPSRLLGFCGVNPNQAWAVPELERCKQLGLVGLKLHLVASKISLLNPEHVAKLKAVFDKARELGMPILVHPPDGELEFRAFVRLTWDYPEVRFIIAHARGFNYREIAFVPAVLKESPSLPRNLYLDVSGTIEFYSDSPEVKMIAWYLRKFGIDRVFASSDFPVHSVEGSFKALHSYGFTKAEKIGLRGENFLKFLSEQKLGFAEK